MPKWIGTLCLLLVPIYLFAQGQPAVAKESPNPTAQELEDVLTEAKRLQDKNAFVNITARAAALVAYSDPVRGEQLLLDLWKVANTDGDKNFDAQQARLQILKHLYSRNAKLARRLIAERQAQEKSSSAARSVGFNDEAGLPGSLAAALLDTDPAAAGAVLEQHLTSVITTSGVGALSQLRQKNFLLADYIAGKAIDATAGRPTLASLPGLHLLGAYVFAGLEAPLPSMEAQSSRQALEYRYFVTGVEVLRASLNESSEVLLKDPQYNQRLLQFRAAYQAELAAILAALAPRFQSPLTAELAGLATKLAPQVPAQMPRLPQTTLARLSGNFSSEDPEQRFFFAMSSGDFDAARSELERIKDGDKRTRYSQLLIKSEARAFLARGELMEAVTAIRKLDDPTTRLSMYMDTLRGTQKKRDADVAKIIVNEARLLIPQTERNGLHLRALLAFATRLIKLGAKDDGVEFLNGAVTTINALGGRSDERNGGKSAAEEAMGELNDPNTLLDEPDMEQAFTAVGLFDLDVGLTHAKRIQPKPVQLVARLQTIQGVIKQAAAKPKPASAPTKVATPANSAKP